MNQPVPTGLAVLDPPIGPRVTPEPSSEPGQAIGHLDVVSPTDGEAPPRQIPVLAATKSSERWLAAQPDAIPDYVKAQWERQGFQIEEHRRLVGVNLEDGGFGAIPVNELAVRYVEQQPL